MNENEHKSLVEDLKDNIGRLKEENKELHTDLDELRKAENVDKVNKQKESKEFETYFGRIFLLFLGGMLFLVWIDIAAKGY